MKKKVIFILAFAFLSINAIGQKINWVTFDEAVKLQEEVPKKIMIDVYASWCGPCKILDKNTFQNKDVADYVNKHYYAVKFNGEGNEVIHYKEKVFTNPNYNPELANRRNSAHELANYFQLNAYPTIMFLDEKAELIAPLVGYKTVPQMELFLKMFKKDEHLGLDSQEKFTEYNNAFKPEFKS